MSMPLGDSAAFRITLIGAGTIGLSFAALHLTKLQNAEVTIYDPRPDIKTYIYTTLPG
jgi:malate/lactate dehydrogenase